MLRSSLLCGLSLAVVSRGYSLVVVHRLLITGSSHAADDKTQGMRAFQPATF